MTSYRPYRFRFSWWHLLIAAALILLALLMQSCRDQYPLPSGIEGRWRQTTSPWWLLDFDNNILIQKAKVGGSTVSMLQFTYAERGDTIYIGGDLDNPPRIWVVRLLSDNDLKAIQIAPDTTAPVWPVYYFERE